MRNMHIIQNTEVIFGPGKLDDIGDAAARLGFRALVVTTDELWVTSILGRIGRALGEKRIAWNTFTGVVQNPTVESVEAAVAAGREAGSDFVIGLGGGSAIDTAKAAAVALGQGGEAWYYRFGGKAIGKTALPILAVSTTAGTGSEVTPYAVVTHSGQRLKSALVSRHICPAVAIVDPELTLSMPPHITASTGFDAYAHAFESTLHKDANDFNDAQAFWAMQQIAENLPKAIAAGNDLEARSRLALASTTAGLCIANVGCTLSHGVGVAIAGHWPKVKHGESLAVTYPRVAALTWQAAPRQYAFVARQFIPELRDADDMTAASRAEEALDLFLRSIGMRFGLSDLGVPDDMYPGILDASFALPDYAAHPVVLDREGVWRLLWESRPSMA